MTFREATILTSARRSPLSAARFQLRHTVHADLFDATIVARAADGWGNIVYRLGQDISGRKSRLCPVSRGGHKQHQLPIRVLLCFSK